MSGETEPTRIRICRRHNQVVIGRRTADGGWGYEMCGVYAIEPCDIVTFVWSSDGSALLAVDDCGNPDCNGGSVTGSEHAPDCNCYTNATTCPIPIQEPCPKCGGRGWVYRAETMKLMLSETTVLIGSELVAVVRL